MKKALSVVLALILLLALCACNSEQEPSKSSIHYSARKAADGSGHFALLNEYGEAVSEPVYSDIVLYENFAVAQLDCEDFGKAAYHVLDYSGEQIGCAYEDFRQEDIYDSEGNIISEDVLGGPFFIGTTTNGTHTEYSTAFPSPYFSMPVESDTINYYILDKYGKPIIEFPLGYYYFDLSGSDGDNACDKLVGIVNGNRYIYEINDGVFTLREKSLAGETGVSAFGYCQTIYNYSNNDAGYGINDSEGNVVIKPIHSYAEIAAADRFILYTGYTPYAGGPLYPNEYMAHLTDTEGNILADYSYIYRYDVDGGSVWLAYYVGDDDYYMGERFNSESDPLGEGYWFIDKDGKRLSPCIKEFESFYPLGDKITSADEVISAVGENGEKLELAVKDYLLK